jgi:hypothetical protein
MSDESNKYSFYRWTRQADKIIVHPEFARGDKFELFYYSDGSSLGTNHTVNASNFALGLLEYTNDSDDTALYFKSSVTGEPDTVTDVASNGSRVKKNHTSYGTIKSVFSFIFLFLLSMITLVKQMSHLNTKRKALNLFNE